MQSKTAALALIVSLVAVLLAVWSGGGRAPAVGASGLAPGAPDADLGARVSALEDGLARMERALADLQLVPPQEPIAVRDGVEDFDAAPYELMHERLDELEQKVAQQVGDGQFQVVFDPVGPRGAGGDQRSVDDWIQTARRSGSTEAQTLAALRALRFQRHDDGADARLDILPEVLEVARTSQDGSTRADVWRQLSGVDDPQLLGPLLDALGSDPHPGAREEAAETLADFLPDPTVESALRTAMELDDDADVREQAARSLARGDR